MAFLRLYLSKEGEQKKNKFLKRLNQFSSYQKSNNNFAQTPQSPIDIKDILPIHRLPIIQNTLLTNQNPTQSLNFNTNPPKTEEGTYENGKNDEVNQIKSTFNQTQSGHLHTFFDPLLIQDGTSCMQTGVRSLVDVPPFFHYPTVGK